MKLNANGLRRARYAMVPFAWYAIYVFGNWAGRKAHALTGFSAEAIGIVLMAVLYIMSLSLIFE